MICLSGQQRCSTSRDVRRTARRRSIRPSGEFLDEFYSHLDRRSWSLAQEPLLLDDVKDAYLAAVAEHLAACHGLPAPAWAEGHGRPLKRAVFAGGLESLKAILTVESPASFRRRLLFVGKDALDRPARSP